MPKSSSPVLPYNFIIYDGWKMDLWKDEIFFSHCDNKSVIALVFSTRHKKVLLLVLIFPWLTLFAS
jgi:hypothetical protein